MTTNRFTPRVESLEGRDVPAVTVLSQGGALVLTGDGANDTVVVSADANQVVLIVNGVARAPLSRAAVSGVVFLGNGGDDLFANLSNINSVAVGGSGNDTLVGVAGRNVLVGGTGDDTLVGGTDDDFISGEAGDDRLFGGRGRDVVSGGTGRDQHFDDDRANDLFDDRGNDVNDASEAGDDRGRGNSNDG